MTIVRPAPSTAWTTITACRACGAPSPVEVLDLGSVPLADDFPAVDDPGPDLAYPLSVGWCATCSLVQTLQDVPADRLFDDTYVYRSSTSPRLVADARREVHDLLADGHLRTGATLLEIGSNDGYLLRHAVEAGVHAVGIDPVHALADTARGVGVETVAAFFDADLAASLSSDGVVADAIVANNVLAHVDDLPGAVAGMASLLAPDGVVRIDVPWVVAMVRDCAFDLVYHEHRCHFGVAALVPLFATAGLVLRHVDHVPHQGGSLRLHLSREGGPDDTVAATVAAERAAGLVDGRAWDTFAGRVRDTIARTRALVDDAVDRHGPLPAYGAAAKATVLTNVVGLSTDHLRHVVDANRAKHGRAMPGVRVPIVGLDRLGPPGPVVLLAWNIVDEVMDQQSDWVDAGGRFLVPLPTPGWRP